MRRTLEEFEAEGLTPAEERLRDECWTGEDIVISETRPDEDHRPEVTIRAEFLRFVIVHGHGLPKPVHEKGVQIVGARITGVLDLEGVSTERDIALVRCVIEETPILRSASLRNLLLNRSQIPGLVADRLDAKGSVFLRGAHVTGEVRLLGAKLGGYLECDGGTFTAGESGKAISADGLEAQGYVFLRGAQVRGEVRLPGAKLGGYLECDGGTFTAGEGGKAISADGLEAKGGVFLRTATVMGTVRLPGAKLGGNLECDSGTFTAGNSGEVINADSAKIEGGLFLRGPNTQIKGVLDLTASRIGSICDEKRAWPKPQAEGEGSLILNRCKYGSFTGNNITAKDRIEWLALQKPSDYGRDFWPQPYEQCAKVLREMGHRSDAREVLIEKERLQREAVRESLKREHLYEDAMLRAPRDFVLHWTVGYGYAPFRALFGLAVFLLIGWSVFWSAGFQGAIKPNHPVFLRSDAWVATASHAPVEERIGVFLAAPEAASYPRFNAFIYSVDTLLPVVSLEMQEYWIPDETVGRGGWIRAYLWLHIAAGWFFSLMAVAGFSGLVRSD